MSFAINLDVLRVSRNVGLVIEDVFGPKETSGHCLAQMVMIDDETSMARKLVGDNIRMPDSRVRAININAYEKILRAMAFYLKSPDTVVSSAQSADPSKGRYAGGVIFPRKESGCTEAIAISAYEALEDEAGVLIIGLRTGRCDEAYVRRVVEASQNNVFDEVHRVYNRRFG